MALEDVLAKIPGYGGFLAKRQMNEREDAADLQQASALMQLQRAFQERQQQQAFQAELAGLGPDATPEQRAQVAARHVRDPAKLLDLQSKTLDRQDATAARREAAADRRDAQKAMIDMRYDQLLQNARNESEKRSLEERRIAEKAEADKRHDITLRLLGELRADASATKPPPGYRKTADGNLEAIPGGPADLKQQGQLNQDTASLNTGIANLDRLSTAANEVMRHPGLPSITGLRGSVPDIPGSAAADARAKLQTLKAQVGFGVLQEMKNSSKTGGALGQVTEQEHKLLQNALAALETAQSTDQIRESLQKVIDYAAGGKERLRQAYNMKHGEKGSAAAPGGSVPHISTDAEYDALPSGTEFIGPDGKKRRKP